MTITTKIQSVILVVVLLATVLIYSTNRINEFALKQGSEIDAELHKLRISIPKQVVSGQLHGQLFHMDRAEFSLKNYELTLREGGDFFADRKVEIKFPGKEVPHGKTFMFKKEKKGAHTTTKIYPAMKPENVPDIRISWKPPGSKFSSTDFLMQNNYDYFLEFGQIDGDKLTGKIYLQVHDQYKSNAKGNFTATITDHEGTLKIADVTMDSLDTFKYLIRNYLTQKYPQDTIEISRFVGGSFIRRGTDKWQQGNMMALFKVNDSEIQSLRVQFAKSEEGWHVVNALRGNQLVEAHPLPPYTPNSSATYCEYIIAQKIEKEVQKNYPNDYIKIVRFSHMRSHTQYDRATEKIAYILGSGQKFKHSFYCEKQEEKWVIAKELADNEYVDFETGEILRR